MNLSAPVPILQEISDLKNEIQEKELELARLRGTLSYLEKKHFDNASSDIKWTEEVRDCMVSKDGRGFFVMTSDSITRCIEIKKEFQADRRIKNMVISTLGIMFKNGEIGRYGERGRYFYGHKSLFKGDLTTFINPKKLVYHELVTERI